jgi:general secretion pathway protein C
MWHSGPSTAHEPESGLKARSPSSGAIDVGRIVAAHVFGESPEEPGAQDPANPRRLAADLLLVGTLAAHDPKQGLAIISSDGRAITYRVGDTVSDAALHSVFRDHVVLSRHGILETLAFPHMQLANGKLDGQPGSAANISASANPADRPTFQSLDFGNVFRGMTAQGPGGKIRGFRVFPTGDAQSFEESGLQSGDLVVAINGASLENQDRKAGQAMFNSIKSSSQTTVTVERNGVRREITVNASQADSGDELDPTDPDTS